MLCISSQRMWASVSSRWAYLQFTCFETKWAAIRLHDISVFVKCFLRLDWSFILICILLPYDTASLVKSVMENSNSQLRPIKECKQSAQSMTMQTRCKHVKRCVGTKNKETNVSMTWSEALCQQCQIWLILQFSWALQTNWLVLNVRMHI